VSLDSVATAGAEVCAGAGGGAAPAAKTTDHRGRNQMITWQGFRGASPEEGDHPANPGPPKEQVQEQYASGILLIPPDDRRKEVQDEQEDHRQHRAPPKQSRRGSHTPARL